MGFEDTARQVVGLNTRFPFVNRTVSDDDSPSSGDATSMHDVVEVFTRVAPEAVRGHDGRPTWGVRARRCGSTTLDEDGELT